MNLDSVTKRIDLAGESFPVIDAGSGNPVLLLHGFPDSRFLWRHQIPALVDAGHRVIAPDLRGFGDAPRPVEVRAYRRPFLVADVLNLLDRLGLDRVAVVGHDWGASLSWGVAGSYPDRITRLAALSVGAPSSPGWDTIAQREKSWYFDLFCRSGYAETLLARDDWKLFREWSRGQGDHERHLKDLARPGALTAGLNWYRGAFLPLAPGEDPLPSLPAWDQVQCPTLGVWSDGDPFLLEAQVALSGPMVNAPWRYERVTDAGHWLMLDQPDRLNALLIEFLRS
ncbi:MAG: alpha/beta fold hydrolase [Gemmatimonadales bacterium]